MVFLKEIELRLGVVFLKAAVNKEDTGLPYKKA